MPLPKLIEQIEGYLAQLLDYIEANREKAKLA